MNYIRDIQFPNTAVFFLIAALLTLLIVQELFGARIRARFVRLQRLMIISIMLLFTFFIWVILIQIIQVE